MKDIIDLLARIFISATFFTYAIKLIEDFGSWQTYVNTYNLSFGTNFLLYSAVAVLILGSALVLLGYRPKFGAFLLLLFIIPDTLVFHLDFSEVMNQVIFTKNIAIIGGLMMVAVNGSGRFSVKKLLASTTS